MNILILNVHSALNLGDDAIMHSTVEALREKYPSARITVAANDPSSWRKFTQLEVVSSLCSWVADCRLGIWRSKLYKMPFYLIILFIFLVVYRLFRLKLTTPDPEKKRLLHAYYESDLVVSCGGGNFYAHHSASPSLFWALITVAFAIGLGKKAIMLPQSIGPIEGGIQRRMARAVISRTRLIMVREPISLDFVQNTLKIKKTKSMVLPDLAFGLSEAPVSPDGETSNSQEALSVGFTIINRAEQNDQFDRQSVYEDAITSTAIKLAYEYKAHIYLFVQCLGPSPDQDDRRITERIYRRIREHTERVSISASFDDARDIRSALKQMDIVVATRMHTAIFALINETPLVLIGYQPKSRGLMNSLGLSDYYCDIDKVSSELLIGMVEDALSNQVSLEEHIAGQMDKVRPEVSSWTAQISA